MVMLQPEFQGLCTVACSTVLLEVTDVLDANKIWQFLFRYIQVNLSINCCVFGIIHSPARPTPDTAPHRPTMTFGACLTVGITYFGLYLCLAAWPPRNCSVARFLVWRTW